MATGHRDRDGYVMHVKGAFEVLLEQCEYILGPDGREPFITKQQWEREVTRLAAKGLRTLAFAFKHTPDLPDESPHPQPFSPAKPGEKGARMRCTGTNALGRVLQ